MRRKAHFVEATFVNYRLNCICAFTSPKTVILLQLV